MPKYIVNGKTYDIPDDKVAGFEGRYPNATVEYHNEGKTYQIPLSKRNGFLRQFPNASYNAPAAFAPEGEEIKPEQIVNGNTPLKDTNRFQVSELSSRIEGLTAKRNKEIEEENRRAEEATPWYARAMKNMARGGIGGAPTYAVTNNGRLNDNEYMTLQAAAKSMRNAQNIIAEADHNAKEGSFADWLERSFAGGAVRGLGKTLYDPHTWDMGVLDVAENSALLKALDAYEAGNSLTEAQQALLDAKAVELATNAYFGSEVGRGYKAGQVTAEAIPFMLEMAINPASTAGKGAVNALTRYALKRFGTKAAKKGISTAAKVATRVVGDVAGASAMAATTGAGNVAANTLERMAGDARFATDAAGRSSFAGTTNRENPATALAKSFGATTIENYSEMLGEYFAPVFTPIGKGLAKGLDKMKLSAVNRFIDDVKMSDIGRFVSDFEKQTQWSGVAGEYSEEVVGGVINALTVGDQTLDTDENTGVFNLEKNIETLTSVALMGGFMSSVKTLGYRTPVYRAQKQIDYADNAGQKMFEDWGNIKNKLDNDRSSLPFILMGANPEQRKVILDYYAALCNYNGVLRGKAKQEAEGDNTVNNSYDAGYATTDAQGMASIKKTMEDARAAISFLSDEAVQRLDENPVPTLELMESEGATDEELQAVRDYVNASAANKGMVQRMNEGADEQTRGEQERLTAISNEEGMVQPVVLDNDTRAYVQKGTLDDEHIVVVDDNGVQSMVAPSTLRGVENPYNAQESIQTMRDEYVNARLAELDNPVEPAQQTTQPVAAQYNYNDEVTILDDNNRPVRATIASNADGDGRMQVETETPVNGKRVNYLTAEEINGRLYEAPGELVTLNDGQNEFRAKVVNDLGNGTIEIQREGENKIDVVPASWQQAQQTEQSAPTQEPIPMEKVGKEERPAYHLVPFERTLEELHGDADLTQQDIDAFITANITELQGEIKKVAEKEPKMGANIAKFKQDKIQWAEKQKALQAKLDYYNELKKRNAELNSSELQEAYNAPGSVEGVTTPDEVVAGLLGSIKITPESFKRETGLSTTEQKGLVGIIANEDKGGVSVERAAEIIAENYSDELAASGYTGDVQGIRNMIISVLSDGNPRTYAKRGAEQRANEEAENRRREIEAWVAQFDMTVEEYFLYEQTMLPRVMRDYQGFDENEYYSILADEYNNSNYDTERESESVGRGREVLQGEQPVPARGAEPVGAGNEGGAVPSDVQGGTANGVAQEEIGQPVGISEQLSGDNVSPVAEGESSPLIEISNDERSEMEARIVDWLSEENLERAEGKTREEIFEEFGNELAPIAYIPIQHLSLVSADLKDQRIYCGKGYFIDHALRNHTKDGKQIKAEDVDVSKYLNIQSVLDNPDSIKETYIDGKRTVVFIKKIGRYFAELTQVEEEGKIVLHKSMFNQKKEPYAKLNDIRSKGTSSEGGVSSISHTAETAPAISLESRGDVISNSTISSASEDRNIVSNSQENAQKSGENVGNGGQNALQNGTNELNLQQNDTDNEQRKVGGVSESGDAISTLYDAASYSGRGNGAATQAGQSGGKKQSLLRALVQRAKEISSWIDDVQTLTGTHITSGGENDVFLSKDGKNVIKINDFSYLPEDSENFNDFINRVQTHNELFPEIPLTIIGYTLNSEGKVSVILKQPFVEAVREATDAEIDAFLEDMGFYTDITGNWTDGNVVIADAKPNNVLVDKNGVLRFIDVIPYDERKEGKMMRIPRDLNKGEKTSPTAENGANPTGNAQEPRYEEEILDNGDKRITNYNSRGEVTTIAIERDGKIVQVDSFEDGAIFEHTEYDENGKSTSVTRFDKDGNVIAQQAFESDSETPNSSTVSQDSEQVPEQTALTKGAKWEQTGEPEKMKWRTKKHKDSHDITWYIGGMRYGSTTAERDLLRVLADEYGNLNAVWNAYEQNQIMLSSNEAAILKKLIETNTTKAELQQGDLSLERENPAFKEATERTVEQLKKVAPVEIATEEQARAMGAFGFSTTKEEFKARAQAAKEQAGIVAYGLNGQELPITQVEKHSFTGNLKNARQEAKSWAENNFVGKEYDMPEGGGKYIITKRAIGKYVDKTAVEKSENPGVHLSALVKLPEIISNSVDAEIHPDYNRGEDGVRRRENGIGNEDMLVHRLYGATEIDGKVYRVKTTMHEFLNGNDANSPHSYEVTQIELIEDSTVAPTNEAHNPLNRSINSISATKLLNGVEKSYDKGKKLLDESKDAPEMMTVYHGSGAKFDRFDHSFMGTGEGAQAFGWGTYVTEVEGIGRSYAEAGNHAFSSLRAKIGNIDAALHSLDLDVERANRELEQNSNESAKERAKYIIENAKYRREALYKERASVEKEMSKLGRNLYTVEIPEDNGSNYLHWEDVVPKKIETAVKERLLERLSEGQGEAYKTDLKQELDDVFKYSDFDGKSLYNNISAYLGGDKQASLFLRDIGFVGINYPAEAMTGGRADKARNYVIFNESDARITDRVEFFRTANGTVYGWAVNGKVYLTPDGINPNTPVHEYTHLWASAVEKSNPKEWAKIVEGLKASPVWNEVLADEGYRDIWNNDNRVASEVLSRLAGRENYRREMERAQREIDNATNPIEAAERITFRESVKQAVQRFWDNVKRLFQKITGKTGEGSWEDFVEMPLRDFWAGVKPEATSSPLDRMFIGEQGAANDLATAEEGDVLYRTSEEIETEYPNWLDGTTTDSGKHSTQVEGTRKTYKKVGDWIEQNLGKDVAILDASSGMGYGTADLRERGFNIEDVEPYQSEERKQNNPATYSSYDDIDKQYDYIISNAVLNVIPDDWRAGVLHDMADKLKVGGKIFINTRKAGEEKTIKDKIELDSPREVLVKRNGRIAAYQRFFTPQELKEWVESELGEDFTVEIANNANSGTNGLAAVVVTKNGDILFRDWYDLRPTNEKVTYDNFFTQTSAVFEEQESRPKGAPDYVSNSGSRYWYGEDSRGEYVIREADHWSEEFTGEDKRNAFNENPAQSRAIASCRWAIEVAPKTFGEIKKEEVRNVNYNSGTHTLNIIFKNWRTTRRDNVAPRDMKRYYELLKSEGVANANDYVVDMVNEKYRNRPIPKQLVGKAYLADFTMWEPVEYSREGYGPASDSEVATESDVYAKALGRPRYTGRKMREYVAGQRQKMVERANELAEKLHLSLPSADGSAAPLQRSGAVEIVTDASTLSGKQARSKGFYSKSTGKITIVIPNHSSVADVEQTLLHEAVAHYGLRQLFGENFDTFLDNVYYNASEEIRAEIDRLAMEKYDGETRTATEEYLASLAENTNFENAERSSWWQKVKRFFVDMLAKAGVKLDAPLTDNELRYILWRSYENLAEPGRYRSIIGEAADIAKQYDLGVGNYAPVQANNNMVAERDVLNREGTPATEEFINATVVASNWGNTHKGAAPCIVIQSAETLRAQLEQAGFSAEDIADAEKIMNNGATGGYNPNADKVVIFKNDLSKKELRLTLWHENAHRAIEKLYTQEEIERVFKAIVGEYEQEVREVLAKIGYEVEDQAEEFLVQAFEHLLYDAKTRVMLEGGKFKVGEGATDESKILAEFIKPIIKFINNGGERGYNPDGGIRESDRENQGGYVGQHQESLEVRNAGNESGDTRTGIKARRGTGDPVIHERALAQRKYEERVKSGMFQSQEALQDSMLSLKVAMQEIVGRDVYIEDIAGFENAYLGENRLSSVNKAEADAFAQTLFKPMLDEVAKLAKTEQEREALTDYMMAKHGIERNRVMAERDARAYVETEIAKLKKEQRRKGITEKEIEAINKNINLLNAKLDGVAKNFSERDARIWYNTQKKSIDSLLENGEIGKAEYNKRLNRLNKIFEEGYIGLNRGRDYAGLTALTNTDNVAEAESKAQEMVEAYEQSHDITALWEKVNAVSKAILQKSYECGMMNKETFEKVSGMYEFYIPLRGFDEKTSAEAYAYLTNKNGAFNAPIRKAEGRSSKADDPFANLQSMAESAIMQGNRNKLVKQRFLNFVLNHPSDLVSVSDLWIKYDDVADEWVPVFPDNIDSDAPAAEVERKMREFEARMEKLAEEQPDRYKKGKDAVNIPYRAVTADDLHQHQIVVKRGGKDIVLTVNGNPRLAQAVNGQTNPDNDISGAIGSILKAGEYINRKLSAVYTTRNPDFIVSNFMRDLLYANSMAWVKEGRNYALRFHRNQGLIANPVNMKRLFAKLRKGELNMNDKTEAMFYEFIMNGGETGYSNIRDIEQHKNDIRKEIKKLNGQIPATKAMEWLGERLDEYNRAIENSARFAAFVTSREMGRSIDRAIYDAKEISVNFNKKGSGAKFYDKRGQTFMGDASAFVSSLGRTGFIFWNAAIQGTTNFGRQLKRHPAKAFTASAVMFALGAIIAALGSDDDEDKSAYYNLPEYVRRSNIMFRAGDSWISIPLPVEYRAMYGMGELMVSMISGKEEYNNAGEIASAIAGQLSQILPIDFMEGAGGLSAFVPSAAKPFVESYITEKSWTGLPLYKDTPYNKDMPEWTKAYKSANKYLVNLAEVLNEATGGDKYTKGAIDINPAKLENLLEGYFGGFASMIDKATKMAETVAGDREYDPRNFLLINRLVKAGDERTEYRAVNNKYFRLRDEYENTKRRLRNYERDTDMGVFDYAEKIDFLYNSPEYARFEIFEGYRRDINYLYKALKEATELNDEREIKELEAELNELKKEMIKEMDTVR